MTITDECPLSVESLNFWYGSGDTKVQAIFDVSLKLERGTLTILRGPSGCGKTTLLTLVGCLRTLQNGSVRLLGHPLLGAGVTTQQQLRRHVGFIFQAHNLHESLTARQNVLMGLQVHHSSGDPAKLARAAEHLLGLLGLGDRLDYLPEHLSGGQKQRVAIARALVSNPEVVFADEPTAALDKDSGLRAIKMLRDLGRDRGTTTLMVTHDNRILDLADRIVDMEDGRIVRDQKT